MKISTKNAALIRDGIVTARNHSKIALEAAQTIGKDGWILVRILAAPDLDRIDKNKLSVRAYGKTIEAETSRMQAEIARLSASRSKLNGFH